MTREEQLARMSELIARLNRASEAYYNGQAELMSDHEWDALFDELHRLEDATGEILPDSPTQKVSEDNLQGQKEQHEFAALSLAKTKLPQDLVKWAEDRPVWISWKLDGLTLVVTYDGGKLRKVVTRGNGHTGTNITRLAASIQGIPQQIPDKGHMVIRGEAVISYDDFNRFLAESGEDYANPRNLASGSLTLKDAGEVKQRHIRWIPFTLVYCDRDIPSWGDRMAFLEENGMETVEHELIRRPDLTAVESVIARWSDRVTGGHKTDGKDINPYPVDGLVVVYDDTRFAATGSVTGHHATRAGLAFKWQDEAAMTTLDHIEWSCAASSISPVAVFAPVELEGTTVKRASLCNISECERLGIGDKGSVIEVIKANKIIPKVIKVRQKAGVLSPPVTCPVCGAPTTVVTSETGIQTLHCDNAVCPAKQLRKYRRFVSKDGLDIDGISGQTLQRFINLGWIREYADILRLPEHAREIAVLEGFGEKSAANIRRSVEKARHTDALRLLYALCIPLCGQDVCKRLLGAYPVKELTEKARTAKKDTELAHIEGIGKEKSASFIRWFKDDANYEAYLHVTQLLDMSEADTAPKGEKCAGLTFVITGDVEHFKNRSELKRYIESQGGKVAGQVSGSTSYLINNDVTSTSGKNQKAQALGIAVISENDFIARFGEAPQAPKQQELSLF